MVHKAAYYDPTKGGTGVYWLNANQSDRITSNDIGVAGAANFSDVNGLAVYTGSGAGTWVLSDGGAYGANSDSYYGTNDQAGNVYEWNDAVISGSSRVLRGGSWDGNESTLSSSFRGIFVPTFESTSAGFRVAGVPEPSSLVLTMLAGSVMFVRRRC